MSPALRRFARYALVGGSTLAFDLALLAAITEFTPIPLAVSTPGAFLVAVSLNYLISRRFVFRGTRRRLRRGYVYFIGIALAGAAATTLLTTGFAALGLYYLAARLMAACCVGAGNYLANLYWNFRVAGHHPEAVTPTP